MPERNAGGPVEASWRGFPAGRGSDKEGTWMRRFLEGRDLALWATVVILALSIWAVPGVRPTSANVPHTPSFTIALGAGTVAPYGIAATPGRLLVTVCGDGEIPVPPAR